MKSSYELAMERLQKTDPNAVAPLTDEQKKQLNEVDTIYKSKIAEREIFLAGKLQEARASRDQVGADQIRQQIANERTRLEVERDEKKDAIRG